MARAVKTAAKRLLLLALFAVVWLPARRAEAQSNVEKQAKALEKKAMDEDYLSTDFGKAEEKLNKAIAMCGTDKCSAQARALLKRDLGVVLIGGQVDKDRGMAAFVDAVKIDPTVKLDPDVKTKELEAAFEQAKGKAGAAGGGGAAGGTGGAPAGDFTHTPVTEQLVRTPVPIYVEYTGSEQLVKVLVRYKGFGMTEFKPLELHKVGNGWGGTVPCTDVTGIGTLQYYVQGFNAQNDPVATAGDRNNTYKVPIKQQITSEAPHLPGEGPPAQCADTGDCPPGFPCAKKGGGGGGGETTESGENAEGKDEGAECEESSECKSNECKDSKCTAPKEKGHKRPKIWIGAALGVDLVFLSGADDVCLLQGKNDPQPLAPKNTSNYYCIDGGTDYPRRSNDFADASKLQAGKAGSVNGGVAPGTIHVLLSFDYALSKNFLLGARVGYVARTYPGSEPPNDGKVLFPPIHIEARLTYLLGLGGQDPLTESKVAPLFMVAAGAAPATAGVDVPVTETGASGSKTVTAYQIGGPAFVALGAGARFAVTDKFGLMVPIKLNLAIGNGLILPSVQPEVAAQFGF